MHQDDDPNNGSDYIATNIVEESTGTSADIIERGETLGRITVPLLGLHNLSNALAAIAVARVLGVSFAQIAACGD